MDRIQLMEKREAMGWLLALMILAGLLLAAPAQGAAGQGTADIRLAQHDKGRTLSGQGVKVGTAAPGSKAGSVLSLPISTVAPGSPASAGSDASISFQLGKRSAVLSGLRFDLTAGTLHGKLGGQELAFFRIAAPAQANPVSGKVSLSEGVLRLTADAADALEQQLGLERALVRKGVGMVWLSAQANPVRVHAVPVVSGDADWGILASWRKYVLGMFGPPQSVGTITTADGATANGNLAEPSGYFDFPAASGTFEDGLYGAADKLVLRTQGSVTFAKPFHCIMEVKFSDVLVTLDGASSTLSLDSATDIDTPEGMTCGPQPPASFADVTFATLDLSGVTPTYSADGKTITWSAIPATLTAAGSAAFVPSRYPAGQALDPVTITVRTG
ncbi:MAG TPA: HtaA domain-containing protein [Solirubrobacterales bacterium]